MNSKHLAAFKAWAFADGNGNATWIIERQEARSLFEQLEAAHRGAMEWKRRNYEKEDEITERWMPLQEQLEVAERKLAGVTSKTALDVVAEKMAAEDRAAALQEQLEALRESLAAIEACQGDGGCTRCRDEARQALTLTEAARGSGLTSGNSNPAKEPDA